MQIQIQDIHGEKCFCSNGASYCCPRLKMFGYSTDRQLSIAIARHNRISKAQSELCQNYIQHLNKAIHS